MNPRMSKKELGLLKGAIRRVFSRSDLRRSVIAKARIEGHQDSSRPRVKKWATCHECKQPTPEYLMQVDHVDPIIPIDSSLDEMKIDDLVNNVWCDANKLDALCKPCNSIKTKAENKLRRENKKRKKL